MKHTIHTPVTEDIQIDLWAQLDPRDYIEPPDPIPMVLENVIQAAGGRKQPTTDAEETDEENGETTETEENQEDSQGGSEEDCEATNTC